MTSTGDKILAYFQNRPELNLREDGVGQYRSNNPFRPGSDSFSFTFIIDPDGEHGAYRDFNPKGQPEKGSLYDLAARLGIERSPNGKLPQPTTKRAYKDLGDYAAAHGVTAQVFEAAGWAQTTYKGRPALAIKTDTGTRYRFLDGNEPPYLHPKGYRRCWYRLSEAADLAAQSGQPLVICNGEASTVVAQFYGLAATAVTSGSEKATLPGKLLEQLKTAYTDPVIVALDCDPAGQTAAPKLAQFLAQAGFQTKSVDLALGNGQDLADFCRLHTTQAVVKLQTLKELEPPKEIDPAKAYLLSESPTDDGNANCFLIEFGRQRYAHNPAWGWLKHNGTHWEYGVSGAEASIRMDIKTMLRRRRQAGKDHSRADVAAAAIPNANKIGNTLTMLKDELFINIEDFDSEPDLINCSNGIIDLRTGQLLPHSGQYHFTYCLPVEYDPDADYSFWEGWLGESVKGGRDVLSYLQQAVGYSLTGHTNEECLFFLYGPSRAGKGTFTESLLEVLGALGDEVDFGTFTARRGANSQNFDLAGLKNVRFIAASESDKEDRLNTAKVKVITGGNTIRAAFKGKDFFSYRPQFKLWLSSNWGINADAIDGALWGRVKVIEFPHSHLGREDKNLKTQMKSPDNLRGILAWAVKGAVNWYASLPRGLQTPQTVKDSTESQQADNDFIAQFLEDMGYELCEPAEAVVWTDEFYSVYQKWSEEAEIARKDRYNRKRFSQELKMRGCHLERIYDDLEIKNMRRAIMGVRKK